MNKKAVTVLVLAIILIALAWVYFSPSMLIFSVG